MVAPQVQVAPGVLWVLGLLALLCIVGIAAAFWRITAFHPGNIPRRCHAVLLIQTTASLVVSVDLLPVIAAETGYMFPRRHAWRWFGVLLFLLTGVCVLAVRDASFEPSAGLSHLPFRAQVVATWIQMAGWSLLAFSAGRFLATECQGREEYARLNGELQATRDLLEQTSRTDERLRIARELHGTLGHHLTALAVNLDLAARLDGSQAKEVIGRAHLVARLLLNDVRDTVAVMRGDTPIDLEESLRALAANLPEMSVHLAIEGRPQVNAAQAHALLRCAQEALTNAVRHGRANQVWISLARREGSIELSVRDDGRGALHVTAGRGLRGMPERLAALGGALDYETRPGAGFHVRALVPLGGAL
jgi:signal transduction histidine kinase